MRSTIERCGAALLLILASAVGAVGPGSSVALRAAHVPGARLQVHSADGEEQVKALLDLARSENATALAARTPRRFTPAATPVARGGVGTTVGSARITLPNTSPGIHTVNGRTQGYVVSPGVYLTIRGLGFDDVMGNGKANIIGEMPGGAAPLRIIDWRDDEIDTLLPPGLSGALDQTVFVQVITNAGKTYKVGGGRFIAERVTIDYTNNVDRILSRRGGDPRVTLQSNGLVVRDEIGPRQTLKGFSPGTDYYRIAPLANGFVVVSFGASCSRTDKGNTAADGGPGYRMFDGQYAFEPLTPKPTYMNFDYGIWRNCQGNPCVTEEQLGTYQLDVTVAGPRGFLPF